MSEVSLQAMLGQVAGAGGPRHSEGWWCMRLSRASWPPRGGYVPVQNPVFSCWALGGRVHSALTLSRAVVVLKLELESLESRWLNSGLGGSTRRSLSRGRS